MTTFWLDRQGWRKIIAVVRNCRNDKQASFSVDSAAQGFAREAHKVFIPAVPDGMAVTVLEVQWFC